MFCPYRSTGTTQRECNFDCAIWDAKNKQCFEKTNTQSLEQIANSLDYIQRCGVKTQGAI